jgi:ABC-type sugar transport system substrate-binding protein
MGNNSSLAILTIGAATLLLLAGPTVAARQEQRVLVFLTREGCVNTTTMRTRLDEALARLGAPKTYAVIDADTLADRDVRRGYGTPTVLYDDRDLFGMPEPTPPIPSPT